MNIIHRPDKIVTERIGSLSIPLKYNALATNGRQPEVEKTNPRIIAHTSSSVENFVSLLNSTDDYDRLPDILKFDYDELAVSAFDLADVKSIIDLSYKLAAIRLKRPPKHVIFSGFSHGLLNSDFICNLKNNGFQGGGLSIHAGGLENFKNFNARWFKDHSIWDVRVNPELLPIVETKPINFKLTLRQQQVANLIKLRGLTNAGIAKELSISEQAVKIHVSLIFKKYGVRTRSQLILAMNNW